MPIQPFLHPDKELILFLDMSSNVDDGVAAFVALINELYVLHLESSDYTA